MPFVFVGALDIIMVLFTLLMGCCGCLKNDLIEEKVDSAEVKTKGNLNNSIQS
jgi:4-hydroxybenzoate polyprenyltransferase